MQALTDGVTYTITADVQDVAGNSATQGTVTFIYDKTHPIISSITPSWGTHLNSTEDNVDQTIAVATSGVEDGQSVTVTLNSQNYSGATNSNSVTVTVPAAHLQALTDGVTYTITADVQDAAGNSATQGTVTFIYDKTNPYIIDVTASESDKIFINTESIDIYVHFSETVVTSGSLQLELKLDSGDDVTPIANLTGGSGTNKLTFQYNISENDIRQLGYLNYNAITSLLTGSGTIKDTAGNNALTTLPLLTSTNSLSQQLLYVKASRPTMQNMVLDQDEFTKDSATGTVTITFSEVVNNFNITDIIKSNGILSDFNTSANPIITARFTATDDLDLTNGILSINDNTYIDTYGNSGYGSAYTNKSVPYQIDTKRPTVSISFSNDKIKIGDTPTITITFSETVKDFSLSDILYDTTVGALGILTDNNPVFTVTFTPNANIEDTTNIITILKANFTDLLGNQMLANYDSVNFQIDTKRPTVSISISDDKLKIGETTTITITFSEIVKDFTVSDIYYDTTVGTLGTMTDNNPVFTVTFTPNVNIEDTTNVITILKDNFTDLLGNNMSSNSDSVNFEIDTKNVLVQTFVVNETQLKIGETATVTIVFHEKVIDFTVADLQAENGTLDNLTTSDGGKSWTATFTPNVDIEDTTNIITILKANFTDLAGNSMLSNFNSDNYKIDTIAPYVLKFSVNDLELNMGESTIITLIFSEAVDFDSDIDIVTTDGTLTKMTSSNNINWTGIFTATTPIYSTPGKLVLQSTYTDRMLNPGQRNTGISAVIGDPYITTITGEKYKLPNIVGNIRLFDNMDKSNRIVINASVWQLPIKLYDEAQSKIDDYCLQNEIYEKFLLDYNATYIKDVFIYEQGKEPLLFNLEDLKSSNINTVSNGIYKLETYSSVPIQVGNISVELQSFANPQIRTGVTVRGATGKCFGALVDHYSIKSIKLKTLNNIKFPKLIKKVKYQRSTIEEEFVREQVCKKIVFTKY